MGNSAKGANKMINNFIRNHINRLRNLIQLLALVLIIAGIYQLVLLFLPDQEISVFFILKALVLAIAVNFGLWFSTQKLGRKYKYLTMLMIIPSIFLNPLIIPGNAIISIMLASLINLLAIILLLKKEPYL